jgi:hypothetical protein
MKLCFNNHQIIHTFEPLVSFAILIPVPQPHISYLHDPPCVFFLGYSREHKGYRCLELSICKIITSRHVLFDEFSFPFAHSAASPSPPHVAAPAADLATSALDLMPLRAGSAGSSVPHPSRDLPDSSNANISPPHGTRIPQPTHDSVPSTPALPPGAISSTLSPPIVPATTPPNSATSTQNSCPFRQDTASHTQPTIPSPQPESTHTFKYSIQAPNDYMHTHSKSGIVVPKKHFNLSAFVPLSPIPTNYRSALKDPNWHNTM